MHATIPAIEPFRSSREHLLAELNRIDLLLSIRLAAVRDVPPDEAALRGLAITANEIDALAERLPGCASEVLGRSTAQTQALDRLEARLAQRRGESRRRGIDLLLDILARRFRARRLRDRLSTGRPRSRARPPLPAALRLPERRRDPPSTDGGPGAGADLPRAGGAAGAPAPLRRRRSAVRAPAAGLGRGAGTASATAPGTCPGGRPADRELLAERARRRRRSWRRRRRTANSGCAR